MHSEHVPVDLDPSSDPSDLKRSECSFFFQLLFDPTRFGERFGKEHVMDERTDDGSFFLRKLPEVPVNISHGMDDTPLMRNN